MSLYLDTVLNTARVTRGLAELMLKDVAPSRFARLAAPGGRVVESNHPAFVYGHLAIYPARLLEFVGADPEPARAPAGFEDLFGMTQTCRDDAEGTIYPSMDMITGAYFRATDAALSALPRVAEARLAAENPVERMRGRLPRVADAVEFLLGPHSMMHLGQVSAWRRMEGLGPCM